MVSIRALFSVLLIMLLCGCVSGSQTSSTPYVAPTHQSQVTPEPVSSQVSEVVLQDTSTHDLLTSEYKVSAINFFGSKYTKQTELSKPAAEMVYLADWCEQQRFKDTLTCVVYSVRNNFEYTMYTGEYDDYFAVKDMWELGKGDCTDYSRSICSILREMEIPCRVAVGIVSCNSLKCISSFHSVAVVLVPNDDGVLEYHYIDALYLDYPSSVGLSTYDLSLNDEINYEFKYYLE